MSGIQRQRELGKSSDSAIVQEDRHCYNGVASTINVMDGVVVKQIEKNREKSDGILL
jgi:predicted amidohydrolase